MTAAEIAKLKAQGSGRVEKRKNTHPTYCVKPCNVCRSMKSRRVHKLRERVSPGVQVSIPLVFFFSVSLSHALGIDRWRTSLSSTPNPRSSSASRTGRGVKRPRSFARKDS
jgi:hypothetical protein